MLSSTFSPQTSNITRPESLVMSAVNGKCCFIAENNRAAYLSEFKHRKDWNSEYTLNCSVGLKDLKSQPKPNRGWCRLRLTVPK